MKFHIREFKTEDIEQLQLLFNISDQYHYNLLPDKFNPPKNNVRGNVFFENFQNNATNIIWVAEHKSPQKIIGLITGEICENTGNKFLKDERFGFISDIVVHPDSRDQGVATSLLQKVQKWFLDNQISECRLSVFTENIGAQKLYTKLGYKPYIYRMVNHLE